MGLRYDPLRCYVFYPQQELNAPVSERGCFLWFARPPQLAGRFRERLNSSICTPTKHRDVGYTIRDIAQAEGSAALMTVLRDFIDEIGRELDARGDKALAPHHWLGFVKLIADIDQNDQAGALRQQMEQIVSQRDVRFQDRCLALIPLLSAEPAIAALFNRRRRAAIAAVAAQ